jgi:acetoin:2,6-dichlorophenolindophenol oxidoreductase subunit alpha
MGVMAKPQPEQFYRTMWLIRRFEERAIELVKAGEIGSGIHPCIGQEAVAVGVCAALRDDDVILSNHRGHGHLLAKGSDPARFMAELAFRVTGIDRGRGGSFHPSDFGVGVYGASGTVGHGAAIATGAAWALGQDSDRIVVSFFGDGAVNQGALLESLNLASLWRVPVVFVCENNRYATTLPIDTAVAGSITGRGEAFGIPSRTVDGMDPDVVFAAAAEAVARARAGEGPSLLEFSTYRFDGHHTFEHRMRLDYRDDEERASWLARDPVELQRQRVPEEVRKKIEAEVEAVVEAAARFAVESPKPDPVDALDYLYTSSIPIRPGVTNA